ncbi:MAG: alanine racemase [Anaerolineae bacterium]
MIGTISLADLQEATGGQLYGSATVERFSGFCFQPDEARPGLIYAAVRDADGDAQRGMAAALAAGASGLICDEPPANDAPRATVLLVGDVIAAVGRWASYLLRQSDITLVGMAGPADTGLTLHALLTVLSSRYSTYANPAATRGLVGLPMSVQGLLDDTNIVAVDLTPEKAADIPDMLAVASPDVLVLTGLGGRFNRTVAQRLLEDASFCQAVVVNAAHPELLDLVHASGANAFAYAPSHTGSDLNVEAVTYTLEHTTARISWRDEPPVDLHLPLVGPVAFSAALAALVVGRLFDVPIAEGCEALQYARVPQGRLRRFHGAEGLTLLDYTFDASAGSLNAILAWYANLDTGPSRKLLVLGALSDQDPPSVIDLGRTVSELDGLIAVGSHAREVLAAARRSGMPPGQAELVYRFPDAVTMLNEMAIPGDLVLVAGSRTAAMERLVAHLLRDATDRDWLPFRSHTGAAVNAMHRATSWLEVDLDAIANNVTQLTRRLGERGLTAVVAANAYGHGELEIAATALANSAQLLAVNTLEEGIRLREGGIAAPILLMGHTPPGHFLQAIEHDLTVTIYGRPGVRALQAAAARARSRVRVHLLVATSPGGLGLTPDQVSPAVRDLLHSSFVEIEGLYTRLKGADDPTQAATGAAQRALFARLLKAVRAAGVPITYAHTVGSAGYLESPRENRFNAVRAGLLIYGLSPSPMVTVPSTFRQALTWKSTIVAISEQNSGDSIGYDRTVQVSTGTRAAVVPVGYADGLRREWGNVLVRGRRAPILGGIGMNAISVDISAVTEAQTGDEVVLIGRQGVERLTGGDVALRLRVSPRQVAAGIGYHVPRFFLTNKEI